MTDARRWIWLIAVGLVLGGAADTGQVGRIADGRQMIFTAVALTEARTLGQPRGRDLTVPRPQGDAVSRYGLGMSFAQVPAAALAPLVEDRSGPGRSQWLFLIAPFLAVLASAWLAVSAARRLASLGAGARRVPVASAGLTTAAILLATLASPFGAYAVLELSEPLQALALIGGFVCALEAAAAPRRAWPPIAAGLWIGVAVLTKSSLLLVAPFALLPLLALAPKDLARATMRAAAGFLPLAAIWLFFEYARFGRPLAGYAGEGFTHPFIDGGWRLLVGVDRGLLLYFPAAVVAVVALVRARRDRRRTLAMAGAVVPAIGLWMLAAPWWAWHGVDGWGPRLLVPAVPLLAAAAATELVRWRSSVRVAFLGLSILINVPPLLQDPTPVVRYLWACAWPADTSERARVPAFAQHDERGVARVPPDQILSRVASASPFVVVPWFFRTAHLDPRQAASRLNAPPWIHDRPDIVPTPPFSSDEADRYLHPPPVNIYDQALAEQVLHAQEMRQTTLALTLADKRARLAPDGFADALLLESYRLLHRKADAVSYLTSLPLDRRQHPAINVVLALWDRDDGKDAEARTLLATSADSFRGTAVDRALTTPLAQWPPDLASMTANPNLEVRGVR